MVIDMKITKRSLKCMFPHKFVENITFRKNYGRNIDWKNPKLMDEKLMYLKATRYCNDSLVKKCTDKYGVREYVHSKNLDRVLVPLLGVYESVRDIDWGSFPEKFVLKCTHGCGYNKIITEFGEGGEEYSISSISKQLNLWMHEDYGIASGEYHYCGVSRKIIAEKFIGESTSLLPVDYKFFCSRGKVICCLLIVGREGQKRRLFVNSKFENLHFTTDFYDNEVASMRPLHFNDMMEIAHKLSIDFPFVRVDLYDTLGQVWFGEMTFSPHGCIHGYLDIDAQEWIGKQIKIE